MSISLASQSTVLNITTWLRDNTSFMSSLSANDIAKKIYWQHAESYGARYRDDVTTWNDSTQVTETLTRTMAYSELRYILIGNCYEGDTKEEIQNYQFCLSALNAILANPRDIDIYHDTIGKFATIKNANANAYYDAYILEIDQTGNAPQYRLGAFDIFNDKWLFTTRSGNDIAITNCRPPLSNQQALELSNFIQSEIDAEKQANRDRAKAEQEIHSKYITYIEQHMPIDTKAVIVAQHVSNDSNSLEDYHGSITNKTVIIGWSKHTRNLFPEMRKAADRFEPTQYLAKLPKDSEHKRSYGSIQAFLKDTPNEYADGWMIYKINLFNYGAKWVPQGTICDALIKNDNADPKDEKKTNPDPTTTYNENSNGGECKSVSLNFNDVKGGIELTFNGKPSDHVLSLLRASTFRWHKKNKIWYAKRTDANLMDAKGIMREVGGDALEASGATDTVSTERAQVHIYGMRELLFGTS